MKNLNKIVMVMSVFVLGSGAMASNTDIQAQLAEINAKLSALQNSIVELKDGIQKGFDLTTENIEASVGIKSQETVQPKDVVNSKSQRAKEEIVAAQKALKPIGESNIEKKKKDKKSKKQRKELPQAQDIQDSAVVRAIALLKAKKPEALKE